MRPDDRDLDEELRGHLALSIRERVGRGEDPDTARRAALQELGYLPAVRDAMRRVWYARALDTALGFAQDLQMGIRALRRARGLSTAVVVTLALGIGANAAIVSVVRGVLLRPLVNRGEDRLIYIRQHAPGLGVKNMTFSIPEVRDLVRRSTQVTAVGEFSTVAFTLLGAGEPRLVHAGVVNGAYFDVMGLRPAVGRLLDARDDGPDAEGAAVLTHRFWTDAFDGDPAVVGRTLQLGARAVEIVGVLEPSVPYPVDTEIIANVVTSPHHLGAVMVTERTHRMTELFGRVSPEASMESARDDLIAAHAAMKQDYPAVYPAAADVQLSVTPLRQQITAPARPVLLLLAAAAAIVFVVACANVANLVLARSARREGELAVRAALGASRGALRRMLLAESIVLCGAGSLCGVLLAFPLAALIARFVARYSVRAADVAMDASVPWTGAALAVLAGVLLAYIPRIPGIDHRTGSRLSGLVRLTPATNRRLRVFAVAQIACSFVLLAGASTLIAALAAEYAAVPAYPRGDVLAIDIPPPATGTGGAQALGLLQPALRQIRALPGVAAVSTGTFVPWRDGSLPPFRFAAEGAAPPSGTVQHARFRVVSPGYFDVLGIPLLAGRDFTGDDRAGGEPVVIVSFTLAQQLFPRGDALSRTMWWTEPVLGAPTPRRIVGVAADVDDTRVAPGPAFTVYHPVAQISYADRLFLRTTADASTIVPAITRIIRAHAPNQVVERAETLDAIRRNAMADERLNALVLAGFASVALLVAIVGVAGVLAFGVSARAREFGVRLAVGSTPRQLRAAILSEGLAIAVAGIGAGALAGYMIGRVALRHIAELPTPDVLPLLAAAIILGGAALAASLAPAVRASRVDVLQALKE